MSEQDVLGVLTPPEERAEKASVNASILEAIRYRKISYPAEIVGDTGLSRQTVYDHVRHLHVEGKIERVLMKMFVPDILKERLHELWSMGLKGNMIKRMSWYRIPEVKDGDKSKKASS